MTGLLSHYSPWPTGYCLVPHTPPVRSYKKPRGKPQHPKANDYQVSPPPKNVPYAKSQKDNKSEKPIIYSASVALGYSRSERSGDAELNYQADWTPSSLSSCRCGVDSPTIFCPKLLEYDWLSLPCSEFWWTNFRWWTEKNYLTHEYYAGASGGCSLLRMSRRTYHT